MSLTVFPHVHVLVLDGAYTEGGEDELVFHDDHGPASEKQRGLAEAVERRFVRWLRRQDLINDELPEPQGDEAWLSSATREPSGLLRRASEPRPTSGLDVHVGRRIQADDERGRVSLVRNLARPPFAEAQLEWLDDEHLRLMFSSPTRTGQSSVVLGRVQLLRRLLWLTGVPPWSVASPIDSCERWRHFSRASARRARMACCSTAPMRHAPSQRPGGPDRRQGVAPRGRRPSRGSPRSAVQ